MIPCSLGYARAQSIGWLFGLMFHDNRVLSRDIIVDSTGFTARELPYEIVAQSCWLLGQSDTGFFDGTVEVFDVESDIRGFDPAGEMLAPGTYKSRGDRRIFTPAGLVQLRECLRYGVASPVVRVGNNVGAELSFTLSGFGWTVRATGDAVLLATALACERIGIGVGNLRFPNDALSEEDFVNFDI